MPVETWRAIIDQPRDGATNMALDEALLKSVGARQSPPVLRLYAWSRPTLSLGFAQPAADADRERIAAHGWEIVRRLTGGRAILHTDEITYSVAFPADHPVMAGGIVESYRRVSAALLHGLEQIGLAAQAEKQARGEGVKLPPSPVCFEVPSNYEIQIDGKKLVGSAQVRKYDGALQHGSLPLVGDISRIVDALVFPDDAARHHAATRVHERATTLYGGLGKIISWSQAAQALQAAFAHTFGVTLIESAPTMDELAETAQIRAERYANEAWTSRL